MLLAEAEEDEEPPTRLEWRDEEEMDCEEIACEVGSGGRAFEDNPMPVLKGEIENCDKPLRILIDSGSGVNLINANVAATLDPSLECKCPQVVRIKVANGVRASLDRTFRIPLKFGAVSADPIICYVIDGLPFDVLIGNPTMDKWQAVLSWATKTFKFQPKASRSGVVEAN